ncbi:hypothetical protein ABMA10_06065 [Plantibacter sp. RU18]
MKHQEHPLNPLGAELVESAGNGTTPHLGLSQADRVDEL